MLTNEQIKQIEKFDSRGSPVLSLYLDLDAARTFPDSIRMTLEDLVKEVPVRLDKRGRETLDSEVGRVQAWLDGRELNGRSLALFSCASQGLWETQFLEVHVKNHMVFEWKPDVAPLLEILDEYERYAVALVDKKRARLFTVFLGVIEEIDAFKEGDLPGKPDHVGDSGFQRHHEMHVRWHMKRVAQHLAELHRRRAFDRLIVAGPEEATSELRPLLPRALALRVVAVIPAEVAAGDSEILRKTLEIERQAERVVEVQLLAQLFETAGAGGLATVGTEATLEALWLEEVRTLFVADGAHMDGSECPKCRRLEPGKVAACPACDTTMRPVHDLVHAAMGRTVELDGRVEVVHDDAARGLRERAAGLGALLRFRVPSALAAR